MSNKPTDPSSSGRCLREEVRPQNLTHCLPLTCKPHSQGRKAERASRPASGQVLASQETQDRQGARSHRAANIAGPRRRGKQTLTQINVRRKPAAAEHRTRSCDAGRSRSFDLPQFSLRKKMLWESDEAQAELRELGRFLCPSHQIARAAGSPPESATLFVVNEGRTSFLSAGRRLMDPTLAVKKQPLKLIPHPRVGHLLAPPALIAKSHSVDYICGYCGQVLMQSEEDQMSGLLIRCTFCGSYNETE